MKKLICCILYVVFCIGMVVGCNSEPKPEPDPEPDICVWCGREIEAREIEDSPHNLYEPRFYHYECLVEAVEKDGGHELMVKVQKRLNKMYPVKKSKRYERSRDNDNVKKIIFFWWLFG